MKRVAKCDNVKKSDSPLAGDVEFLATIKEGPSGMQIGDDGALLHLCIPEVELPNALPAIRYRQQVIRVTIGEA